MGIKYVLTVWLSLCLWYGGLRPSALQAKPSGKEKITLLEAIEKISRKFDVYFTFDVTLVAKVEVQYEQALYSSAEDAIARILNGTGIKYQFYDRRFVILYKDDASGLESLRQMSKHLNGLISQGEKEMAATKKDYLLVPAKLPSQSILKSIPPVAFSVEGRVTNQDGEPLIGVTVQVKGDSKATTTDNRGHFSLSEIDVNAVLVFSYVGFKTQEIKVGGQVNLKIIMVSADQALGEVVVVGYGTQKKVNLTGAVSVVSKEIFENRSVPDAMAAMQGKIPGVSVTRTNGAPGAEGYSLQIRGASSVNNVDVLVLIDGVVGSLSALNPSDIESMSVLKDAAASAIYGSNASGGVLLVTTKKGASGKTKFEYSSMYGMSKMGRLPHPVDAYTQFSTLNIGNRNMGAYGLVFDDPVKIAWFKGERLDEPDKEGAYLQYFEPYGYFFIDPSRPNVWQSANSVNLLKEYTKEYNPLQTHNLSIRGGNEKNTFFLSAGYYDRKGILRYGPDSEKKYYTRLNINNELNRYLNLNSSISFTNNNIYQPGISTSSILENAYARFASGVQYGPTGDYFASHGLWQSMVQEMKEGGVNTNKIYNVDARTNLTIKNIIDGLTINVVGSKNYGISKLLNTRRTLTYLGVNGSPILIVNNPNNMRKSSAFSDYTTIQAYATYTFKVSTSHNFGLLGGYAYEDFRSEGIVANANRLVTNDFFSLNWGNPDTKSNTDNIITWTTVASFGRLNYNFREKYLFEANLRYDGSSRLASANRWHTFPSLSVGWNIDKETFFRGVGLIQHLKLRASWGQLGNSNALGYYDYIGLLYSASNLPLNNVPTQYIYQNKLASPTKTWETVETSNIGLDLTALNGRLTFTADAYIKKNKNMLAELEVPDIIGIGLPTYNVGELETKGWEMEITWREMFRKFKYWVTFNLSDNTNKLVKYNGRSIVQPGLVNLIEGKPLGTLWGYRTDGLFRSDDEFQKYDVFIDPKTGAGDMKYLDLDGNKKIDAGEGTLSNHGDLVLLGNNAPRYMFGTTIGFQWKGFDFSVFLQGVGKRKFYPDDRLLTVMINAIYMPYEEQLDYWTPENPTAYWPRPYVNGNQSFWKSDYWVQDAAYIRLKNIEIGYTLPESISKKAGITKARFFATGQDLWEATKTLSYIDPESPNNVSFIYPFYRSASLGLNITF